MGYNLTTEYRDHLKLIQKHFSLSSERKAMEKSIELTMELMADGSFAEPLKKIHNEITEMKQSIINLESTIEMRVF